MHEPPGGVPHAPDASPDGTLPDAAHRPSSLRRPGAILLISCYELGHQPLSIASPLALLREAGYSAATLDLSIQHLDPDAIARARLIAIAVPMHTALRIGARVAERIRAINPACHLCFYGLYATLNAEALLARGAHSIIGGEFEEPLLRLVEHLDADDGSAVAADMPSPHPGASSLPGVAVPGSQARPWLRKIRFAVPRRDPLLTLDRYARLEVDGESRIAAHVEASRGCLHHCRHCPIPPVYGGRFFVVPRDVVLGDIRNQVAAGATHITFGDPDFLNGPGHSMALLREMHAEFPSLTFDCTAKIEHLLRQRELLTEMAHLGCLFIVSAVESLSDEVLRILDKGHTRADVEEVLRLVRAAGITLRPSFVPFTPWTTLQDYRELLAFLESEDLLGALDPVQLSIRLLLPPGSLLLERPEMKPFLGRLDSERFTYLWTHPDPRMGLLQEEVSAIVELGARKGEDPLLTFARIMTRASRDAQDPAWTPSVQVAPAARRDKGRPPRLSEPWFC